jgi:hypothetical protein
MTDSNILGANRRDAVMGVLDSGDLVHTRAEDGGGIGSRRRSAFFSFKTVPYVPLSHPFVERLIGTIRRECLDRTLFWTGADLENKLLDFRTYFNHHRTHTSREGRTPDQDTRRPRPVADLNCYRWRSHCRGLYHTPMAA